MADIVERLRLAAPLDVHVLLTVAVRSRQDPARQRGPPGVAPAPQRSVRRDQLCDDSARRCWRNELFGAEPGAHSAATRGAIKGKVEAAERGTLFLDEIASSRPVPSPSCSSCSRTRPTTGSAATQARRADVRVVAATNANLKLAIAERNSGGPVLPPAVLEVHVPSLAERPEDLVPLSFEFLRPRRRAPSADPQVAQPGSDPRDSRPPSGPAMSGSWPTDRGPRRSMPRSAAATISRPTTFPRRSAVGRRGPGGPCRARLAGSSATISWACSPPRTVMRWRRRGSSMYRDRKSTT